MKTHDFIQGSQDWHDFRANHYGASEASAMLGLSPYKSRTQLLKEKKTGIAPDVDSNTQRIFDRGHEIEATSRAFAEHVIGDDLYPVTCSDGILSASCDGLTLDQSIAWECKSSNKADIETVIAGELPEKHWPQCQQVLMVTGAEKLLFTISDGTEHGSAHVWVLPNPDQMKIIVDGWDQFARDLETFEPEPEVIVAKAEPVMALPSLSIQVGGSISIQSNLEKFGERLKGFIEETNAKPKTDQDFANLEQACKVLKEAEDALKQAESNALAQTASVDEMRRTVAFLADVARTNRLTFEKLVKSEKEARKLAIVANSKDLFSEHYKAIQAELPVVFNCYMPNFAEAIKGKKTLSSMQDSVNTMLANAKIEADGLARELREKHAWYIENAGQYSFLFSDLQTLIYKDADSFQAVARNRILTHQEQEKSKAEAAAKDQAEREERIRREAEEKAQRESEAREKQIAEDAAKAERDRIAAEQEESYRKADEELAYLEQLERENQEELERGQQAKTIEDDQSQSSVGMDDVLEAEQSIDVKIAETGEVNQEAIDNTALDENVDTPSRFELVETIANEWNVSSSVAEQWLVEEFSV
jgi:putative phage-type endonuclease